MADFLSTYDPEATIPDHTTKLGDVLWGDCWNGMPAIIVEGEEELPASHDRYPKTIEEYELYGAQLPVRVKVNKDIQVSCETYQRLRNLPMPVAISECSECPLAAKD